MLQKRGRKGDAKTSPAETSVDKTLNPINQRITTLNNTSSLARFLPDQKGGTRVAPAERRGIIGESRGELRGLKSPLNFF